MDNIEKAEKILSGQWPKDPIWIYESPDGGKTVYRHIINNNSTTHPRQLYMINSKRVDTEQKLDDQYFTQVYKW